MTLCLIRLAFVVVSGGFCFMIGREFLRVALS
jgi:hypothetical protein